MSREPLSELYWEILAQQGQAFRDQNPGLFPQKSVPPQQPLSSSCPSNGATAEKRLNEISTLWTMLFRAHTPGDAAAAARQALVLRYHGAVYRYLLGAVRDEETADDLAQRFAERFLRGDFRGADPQRGRFRDYLKTALIHLVNDHHRDRQQQPGPLPQDSPAPSGPDSDADFLAGWREELLEQTWKALKQANTTYHAVLLFHIDNPDSTAAQMAEQLSVSLGRQVTAAWVRKTLQRAREKYAELLIEEVATSLEQPSLEQLEEELQELNLLPYCRLALTRRKERHEPGDQGRDAPGSL
jgi:RNA polymerase sigma-70 factor (ECF subfamily)